MNITDTSRKFVFTKTTTHRFTDAQTVINITGFHFKKANPAGSLDSTKFAHQTQDFTRPVDTGVARPEENQ